MIQIKALEWIIEVDAEATKSYYETADTDLCDCVYCRNYVAAFPDHFPSRFLEFLHRMMIDPLKPAHIYELGRDVDNNRAYGGYYDFEGTVIKESKGPLQVGERFNIDDIPSYVWMNIRFYVVIPWVLDEEGETYLVPEL
jgi:hypothetical protein